MIKYIIALLLISTPCLAGMGIGVTPYPGPGVMIGAVPPSYLLSEDFEAGTAPTGWTNNSAVFNATPALDGTYSATVTGSAYTTSGALTATGDVYAACLLQVGTALPSSTVFLKFLNGATELAGIRIRSTGAVQANATQSATGIVQLDTPIYLKLRYIKGTGSNATVTIWSSATGASGSWTQRATDSTGTWTADMDRIRIASASDGTNALFKIDKLRVSSSDINY